MKTMTQIREDLRAIRFYYSRQKDLDHASKPVGTSAVQNMVERYNQAICNAPVRLYDLYYVLYVQGNTQVVLAKNRGCSIGYIRKQNKQLCEYLRHELKDGR